MKKTAQKIQSSTQKFIEIQNIIEDTVLLSSGNACSVIEVTATNFTLLSREEQDAKIVAYGSLLNSLSFPIQIFIRNRRIDISSYLTLLGEEALKTQNKILADRIKAYRDFVKELVEVNSVLDKKFYIVVFYSFLEEGVAAVSLSKNKSQEQIFLENAKTSLLSKLQSLNAQLARLSLKTKTLGKEDLIRLFYEAYNGDSAEIHDITNDIKRPIVKNRV